jgi:hypothetical protein
MTFIDGGGSGKAVFVLGAIAVDEALASLS